ncbi:MAG: beta-ketoacyl-[acyl-carrier-protein] synthase family protein [Winogradskyella sp.]|uniref:beta-ketoacyl-[acyl-carrier-protein] synthase family protein n=1 Tax=Winogradskyella sp. TaxID=1883156 RepID=UPI001804608E|nr:beta-ketoacyl-[acyl-carrier-protein] synthase family protein [Winogradskyella sp.]MBT8243647.1 beta-ketoacyl-[acyl-carrier-protein] synthase family protein [Winogradskyella sp.]NNK22972.1 beta-ketoacyl-[acyl-carrier-protein] synthase family protein [Winogradskyella sp.]
MKNRVVITGLGIVAPNGVGISEFTKALKSGKSGITFHQELADLNFSCQIGGVPNITDAIKSEYFTDLQLRGFNSSGILYGCISGIDAWKDAGFNMDSESDLDYDTGLIFGTGTSGVEKFREAIYKLDEGNVRRLGSTVVLQTMASGVSAYLSGMLGLGNQVTTNSSACTTGTEALLMGFERIQNGKAKRMLVGSCSDHGPYVWGGFDAMRVMTYKHNNNPESSSRPMSATASGFVPGSGAGALVLESLESAIERGVKIYAEVLGGEVNSGGQRQGGTLTAPNAEAVQRCITKAIENSDLHADEIDVINGHLTATSKDALEVENWTKALKREGEDFPYMNSTKSMVGHCLAAAGAIECLASVIQLKEQFVAPNINCEDLHPEIEALVNREQIPTQKKELNFDVIAKASFGFGDVNACVLFKRYIA